MSENDDSTRAPAVYFVGSTAGAAHTEPVYFRLPSPPLLERARHAWALERRAKKIYFAVLDAMRTGRIDAEHAAKLGRLLADVSTRSARSWLHQLERALAAALREGEHAPILPSLRAPLQELVGMVVVDHAERAAINESAWKELAWPLEWMRTRGYIVTKDLHFSWQRPRTSLGSVWTELRSALERTFTGTGPAE